MRDIAGCCAAIVVAQQQQQQQHVALRCIARVLSDPTLDLQKLTIKFDDDEYEESRVCMNTLVDFLYKCRPRVRSLHADRIDGFIAYDILDCLEEVTDISLDLYQPYLEGMRRVTDGMEDLFELDQWKNAKTAHIESTKYFRTEIEHFLHFESISVNVKWFSVDDANKVKKVLDSSSNFKSGIFEVKYCNPLEIAQVFDPSYAGDTSGSLIYKSSVGEFKIDFSEEKISFQRQ